MELSLQSEPFILCVACSECHSVTLCRRDSGSVQPLFLWPFWKMLVSKSDDSGWENPLCLMPQQTVTLLDLQEIRPLHSSVCLSSLKHTVFYFSPEMVIYGRINLL